MSFAPSVWTDASKSRAYTGGGFVSACGRYDFWKYGAKAQRKFIDYLEGDTVTVACQRLAHLWRGCVVCLYCDISFYTRHFFLLRKLATGAPMHRTVG